MPNGSLLLLPNLLDESLPHEPFLPASVATAVVNLDGLIAESEKSGRRYLRRFLSSEQMRALPIATLNEHTPIAGFQALLAPIEAGERWGLVSDAGLACIADPGAQLVAEAREKGVEIQTFVGPSSLFLALQLSGFAGQCFCFYGYLPREELELEKRLRLLEKGCREQTQIWVEAPYRTQKMVEICQRTLQKKTWLCVASELTLPSQRIFSFSVGRWKRSSIRFGKERAVFLISQK